MTAGVVFYTYGDSYIPQLAVALYTLKKVYKGKIAVIYKELSSRSITWLRDKVDDAIEDTKTLPLGADTINSIWIRKATAHVDLYPYDLNLYYDVDHIFQTTLDLSVFELIDRWELVNSCVARKADLETCAIVRVLTGEGTSCIHADGGCVGAKKNSKSLNVWLNRIAKMRQFCRIEEIALAACVSDNVCKNIGAIWNTSNIEDQVAPIHTQLKNHSEMPLWVRVRNQMQLESFYA